MCIYINNYGTEFILLVARSLLSTILSLIILNYPLVFKISLVFVVMV